MDTITDMLIRIKNAGLKGKTHVSFAFSGVKMAVAEALNRSGFVGGVARKGKRLKMIEVLLLSGENGTPKISGFRRLSKQSRRYYKGNQGLRPIKNGFGKLIVSTSRGVMTGEEARKEKVGGELLFEIW